MLKTSFEGLQLIKQFESFRPRKYLCPAGLPTIGFGHVIRTGEKYKDITLDQAEMILSQDIMLFEKLVSRYINVPLKQNQFDALVSFSFNVGGAALQRSTLRQKVNRLEFDDAPREFIRWVYSGGVQLKGLVRRRRMEAQLFSMGL